MQATKYYDNFNVLYIITSIGKTIEESTINQIAKWIPNKCLNNDRAMKILLRNLAMASEYGVALCLQKKGPENATFYLSDYSGCICAKIANNTIMHYDVAADDFAKKALPTDATVNSKKGLLSKNSIKYYFESNTSNTKYEYDLNVSCLITNSISKNYDSFITQINGFSYEINILGGYQKNLSNGTIRKIYYTL